MANKKFFTEDHEWIEEVEGKTVRVGISDYAQDQLGDIVFVELPDVDDSFDANEEFGTVESVKSASEIFIPFAGKITKVNDSLEDEPEKINESPRDEGWLAEFELENEFDGADLMDEDAYKEYVDGL